MLWLIYNIMFTIGFLLLLPGFLLRMRRRGGYRRGFLERVAVISRVKRDLIASKPRIWIHAVSVGEVTVALEFIAEFKRQRSDLGFVVTTTTSTGHAIAERKLAASDVLLYFPVDFPCVMRRALSAISPRAILLVETELWPNMIRLAGKRGIPVALVNGRISARSEKGYRLMRRFFTAGINMLNAAFVQTDEDLARLLSLGLRSDLARVSGSAKYDVARSDGVQGDNARAVLAAVGFGGEDRIIVAGSTWPGEEEILLEIFSKLKESFAGLRLVLVPRHFERANAVESAIQKYGFGSIRRSGVGAETAGPQSSVPDVLLVDTTGELVGFYECASAIFVGKSLTQHGGQNVIEPAALGKAIAVGPNMENFPEVAADFLSADAMVQVRDAAELEAIFRKWLEAPDEARSFGARAASVVHAKRGAVASVVQSLLSDVLTERQQGK
jgi:3-deoxy-D-manno-octulosonic-acid transferase